MKSCAKQILALAAALLLSACASRVNTRPQHPAPAPRAPSGTSRAPAPAAPAAEQPETVAPAPAPANTGTPDERFQAALQLLKDKKRDEAQAALLSLAQDHPNYAGPLCDLGVLYAESKQHGEAIGAFTKAIQDDSHNSFAYDWLGILYRENGNYGLAEKSYLKAISIDSDNAAAHLNLGILYDNYLNRPQDALTQYHEYQRIAGTGRAVVTAWINELQERLAPAGQAAAPGSQPALEQK